MELKEKIDAYDHKWQSWGLLKNKTKHRNLAIHTHLHSRLVTTQLIHIGLGCCIQVQVLWLYSRLKYQCSTPISEHDTMPGTEHAPWKWTVPCECHLRQISRKIPRAEHLACPSGTKYHQQSSKCHARELHATEMSVPRIRETHTRDSHFLSSFTCRVLYKNLGVYWCICIE